MAGQTDSAGPGSTAPVVAATVAAPTVQAAINTHVATYQQQLEAKIKATLADTGKGLAAFNTEIGSDVKAIVTGSGISVGTGAAAHALPRYMIWIGFVLAIVGAIALGGVVLAHLPIKL